LALAFVQYWRKTGEAGDLGIEFRVAG